MDIQPEEPKESIGSLDTCGRFGIHRRRGMLLSAGLGKL